MPASEGRARAPARTTCTVQQAAQAGSLGDSDRGSAARPAPRCDAWLSVPRPRPLPQVDGRIEIAGLEGEVTVYRDAWGIPQIYAADPDDLFRAQGYVHAQDRFW